MKKKSSVQDVINKIETRIWNDEMARRLTEKVELYDKTKNSTADLTQQEAGMIYHDDDYGTELPLSRKRDVEIDWSNHAEYRSDLRDVRPDGVNRDIAEHMKNHLAKPEHRKETLKKPEGTMVIDYNTGRNPATADVITVWASDVRRAVRQIKSSMCEQRSHLPGDAEWTTQSPKEMSVNTDTKQPSQLSECQQCRRSWARRMRGISGLPGATQEENSSDWKAVSCTAASGLPGDESQMGEGVEPTIHESEDDALDGNFNDTRREMRAGDDDYRHDPRHEHHPEGPGWRETDRGWSRIKEEKPIQQQQVPVQPSKPAQPEPKNPEQSSGVKIHIPDHELTHRVMLKKKEDLKRVLDLGHYSIISGGKNGNSDKERDMLPTDPMFHERTLQLRDDLERAGVPYTEVVGVYDSIEPSFMVLHDHEEPFTDKTARNFMVHHRGSSDRKTISTLNRLGEKYNQDSVLHVSAGKNTMVFTTGKQKGKHCGNKGWKEIPEATNYYTDIPVENKEQTKVQVNIQQCFDKGYIKASELLRIAREILASDNAPYRHDPKHHHRPLGGKWRRTPAGWSQLPSDAKSGPVPEKKVEHKPGVEGVKQMDTQTQNG